VTGGVAIRPDPYPDEGVPMLRLKRVAAVVIFLLLANVAAVYAQQTSLSDEQVKERLAFITTALADGQPAAKRWWYGWIAGYSAGAAAMGVLAATDWKSEPDADNSFAEDMLIGSATFALGVVGLAIDPFTPATAAKKLRPLPETTELERQAKLKRAEELLRQCAKREKSGRSLTTHLLNAGVNAAAGVVTVAAFDRPAADGLTTFAIGEAISLLNIFTQPMRATRDLKKYEAGYLAAAAAAPRLTWSLTAWPGGFGLNLRF
jgi:hypothetical protein